MYVCVCKCILCLCVCTCVFMWVCAMAYWLGSVISSVKSGSHSSPLCRFQESHSDLQVCAVQQKPLPTEQSHEPSSMLWKDAYLGTGTEENGNIV